MNEILTNLIKRHPNMLEQIEKRGRCWLSISRSEVKEVVESLEEHLDEKFQICEIKPEFEHVIYIPDQDGNEYHELLKVAKSRAEWRKRHQPPF